MKFREAEEEVRQVVSTALQSLKYEADVDVEEPRDPQYGDLSTAVALRLAKKVGEKPSAIAQEISSRVDLARAKFLVSVSPHPGGYLNFGLKFGAFAASALGEILQGEQVGRSNIGRGRRLLVEHTNVNPNKALHIGHARNLVLGDSLVRIMTHLGYDVQALDYVDDSGSQVADVIVGFKFLGLDDKGTAGEKFDAYCGDMVYVRVNQEYERNPALKEKQALVLREIEKGKGEIAEYTREIVRRILRAQLETCWQLSSRYDLLNWETHILQSKMWEGIFEQLKQKGIARYQDKGENAGCWVVLDRETNEEKILVRSDGTVLYIGKDIPYAAWKVGLLSDPFEYVKYATQPDGTTLWSTTTSRGDRHPSFGSADIAVTVIDARQSNLQRIVGEVLDKMSPGAAKKYLHRSYEVVSLSKKTASSLGIEIEEDFVHMQGRKGVYVNVDTILDALKKKAFEETRRRNPEESEDWTKKVAEAIAVAALRFELVKQDPDKMIVFDIEEALRLEGETGPYIQYTYARARRILEKAGQGHSGFEKGTELLLNPLEKQLVKAISKLDKALMTAGEYLSPKEVARYVHGVALLFNQFYEAVPVNRESDANLRAARLALVDACSRVIREAADLIGITCVERI